MNFRFPGVTVDDPYFGDTDGRVKRELLLRLVAGAVDFDHNIRRAFKVFIAVDAKPFRGKKK
jgi:hypothetical protein